MVQNIGPPYDGACIADEVHLNFLEWKVDKKVMCMTLDNASYNDKMIFLRECHSASFIHLQTGLHRLQEHSERRVDKKVMCMTLDNASYNYNAETQHTTAWCSVQVVDIILIEGPIREYYIPHSGTTKT